MVKYIVLDKASEPVLDFDTEVEAREFIQLNEGRGFRLDTVFIIDEDEAAPEETIEDRYAYESLIADEREEAVQQMAEKILKFVKGYQPASYAPN